MATYSKVNLSASTHGKAILVAGTNSGSATTIHTTGISATVLDEVWLFAFNADTTARKLTIEFGGTTSPGDTIILTVPPQTGQVVVISGQLLCGNGSAGLSVRAFCAAASVVSVVGYVNRITP